MAIRIDGTNTAANPGITGADADTGLQFGTDEVSIVTGGTDRVKVDGSGKVGIGESSPDQLLHLKSPGFPTLRVEDADNSTYFDIANSDGDIILKADEGNTFANSAIRFMVDSSEKLRIQSGGGISFNGDTAAANALDDYEEGTFTPGLRGTSAGTGSFSPNANGGIYRKIGDVVYFQANLSGTWTNGTASGNVEITGLPFACRTVVAGEGGAAYSPVTFPYMQGITPATAGYYRTGGLVIPGQTYMHVYQGNGNGGVQTSHVITEVSTATNAVNWHLSGFYPVA